jgi:uncharacterized membrane protein
MAGSRSNKTAGAYARQAASEWGDAFRYGARALAAKWRDGGTDRTPLKERLNPSTTDKGGRLGDLADLALSKFGTGGKIASKVSLGSRIVERIRGPNASGGPRAGSSDGSGDDALSAAPVPIQESIDVAVPVSAAFALCTRFAEYPEFLDRVVDVEESDDSHVAFTVSVRGRHRELQIELRDERPDKRLDWDCKEEIEHSGVLSFHPLAPRLTRLELTIQFQPHGLVERLARKAHLTERVIAEELHRFKAYAELWEDPDEEEPQDDAETEEEPEDYEEPEGYEPEDEEDLEEEPEDEEYLEEEPEDEEDLDEEEDLEEDELDEEELEEEELEPAGSGR